MSFVYKQARLLACGARQVGYCSHLAGLNRFVDMSVWGQRVAYQAPGLCIESRLVPGPKPLSCFHLALMFPSARRTRPMRGILHGFLLPGSPRFGLSHRKLNWTIFGVPLFHVPSKHQLPEPEGPGFFSNYKGPWAHSHANASALIWIDPFVRFLTSSAAAGKLPRRRRLTRVF